MKLIIQKAALFVLFTFCISLPALAQVNWPNAPAPCDDPQNLEACILAQPGEAVIEINANAINGTQSFGVNKSVVLRPAPGFTPVFNGAQGWTFSNSNPAAPADVRVIIEGLTFVNLSFAALQVDGNAAMNLEFRNNQVEVSGNSDFRIRGLQQPSSENMNFIVEDNEFSHENADGTISVSSSWSSGNQGVIRNNRFEVSDLDNEVIAISGPIGQQTDLSVDLIGNRIQGSNYSIGIRFSPRADGRLDARVINNVVSGQENTAGFPSALVVNTSQLTALGDIWFINNTLVDNGTGIGVFSPDAPEVRTFIYNNIVAFSERQNYGIQEGSTVSNDFNLSFASGLPDIITPGPNFLNVDPLFVSATNSSLQPFSPAIDSGDSSQVPVDITLDIAGNPRILGPSVDRGAYEVLAGERPLPESVPVPMLSIAGLVGLTLLMLLLGFWFRPSQ